MNRTLMAFNRTSMESKHVAFAIPFALLLLLIEPVWNRNPQTEGAGGKEW